MHYRTEQFGFDVLSHIDDFTKQYTNVLATNGDTVEIAPGTPAQVLVLTPAALK